MPPKSPPNSADPFLVGGSHQGTTGGRDAHAYLWVGTIVHVDSETMVCSIRLNSGMGERHDVPLPAPAGAGPRSWAGLIPEKGTKVLLGWKKYGNRHHVPYIIEFMTPGIFPAREYEPFSSVDPALAERTKDIYPDLADDPRFNLETIRLKNRKAYPGDFVASSSSGSDFLVDRDCHLINRAGNEFRLRDSDQTAILQTINEFTSNGAGYYRRGLIKRNAFNFLPDLYPLDANGKPATVISPGDSSKGTDANGDPLDRSPAYNILLQFGLIKPDGSKNFPDNPSEPFYPYVVAPDGQRISYVVHGEHDFSFAESQYAYIEDRKELRHLSYGVMAVTEEGDGFQIDPPYPVFIEDVSGTIVGNDFHSESGRPLYKRVLTMRLFSGPDQASLADGPTFEPVDTIQKLSQMDDLALARLFRIQSPNGSNQYCFGVTKEGRVFLHIPKTKVGETHEKGKSADINIQGLVKAIIGADENYNNTSLDLKLLGGMNLDIGRLTNGASVNLTLRGKVRKTHIGNDANGLTAEDVYGGSVSRSVSASAMDVVGGNSVEDVGAEKAVRANSIIHNAGPGGYKQTVAGDVGITVLGQQQAQHAQIVNTTLALGKKQLILLGVDQTTMLAGSYTYSILAGSISTSIVAGNISTSVVTGNMSVTVATGNYSATVGSGAMSFSCPAGPASLVSGVVASMIGGAIANVTAPFVKIGLATVGFAVAGIPGPPGPHLDYIVGIPILGVPTIAIG